MHCCLTLKKPNPLKRTHTAEICFLCKLIQLRKFVFRQHYDKINKSNILNKKHTLLQSYKLTLVFVAYNDY